LLLIVELLGFLIEEAGGKGHEAYCIATQVLACNDSDDGMVRKVEIFALENQFLA
jgi:hypothetical protein